MCVCVCERERERERDHMVCHVTILVTLAACVITSVFTFVSLLYKYYLYHFYIVLLIQLCLISHS